MSAALVPSADKIKIRPSSSQREFLGGGKHPAPLCIYFGKKNRKVFLLAVNVSGLFTATVELRCWPLKHAGVGKRASIVFWENVMTIEGTAGYKHAPAPTVSNQILFLTQMLHTVV